MKTFSVLTVSKRRGWELLATKSMAVQTRYPKQWVVVSEENLWQIKTIEPPRQLRPSNLNASLNKGLKQIKKEEYVIFYQDFIELPQDCFEKLLDLVDEKTFVTTCTPNYDGSNDDRYTDIDKPRECLPKEWEANVSIAPMKVLRELGGFPEHYDFGWAFDNVNIAERAAMLGCKFIIDESNRPKLHPHELTSKLEFELNDVRHVREMRDIRLGQKPLKYSYL